LKTEKLDNSVTLFFKQEERMKRVLSKSRSFKEAEKSDILQHVRMTPEQRREAAAALRERVYGKDAPDVRKATQQK
jgi:hypothetical protein